MKEIVAERFLVIFAILEAIRGAEERNPKKKCKIC